MYETLIQSISIDPPRNTSGSKAPASTHTLLDRWHMETSSHGEHIMKLDWLIICLIVGAACDNDYKYD